MDWLMVPVGVKGILRRFRDAGQEAYLVGGCVRDTLLGRTPEDWDICTAALPEQTMALFDRTVPTGIQHGTVTVFYGGAQAEVTTFRKDGRYTDHRRPDEVRFTRNLIEDLGRRDFTVNAMAIGLDNRLIDPFFGRKDLKNKHIRCVGLPDRRFQEDALRMFRALRFSAQLGWGCLIKTRDAIERNAHLAQFVAPERILVELEKTLLSSAPYYLADMIALGLLDAYLSRPDDFSPLALLAHVPAEKHLRWAHFCHALKQAGAIDDVGGFLRSLRVDGHTTKLCEQAAEILESPFPADDIGLRRLIAKYGPEAVRCAADCKGPLEALSFLRVDAILYSGACLDLAHLAVNGTDLQALGYTGADIGKALHRLLDAVLEDPSRNDKETLLKKLKEAPHG